MSGRAGLSVLFTGYTPVHFACFRPVYERLAAMPGVEIFLSGGLRSRAEDESGVVTAYDGPAMYRPFGIPPDRVLPVERIRRMDFDALFAANTKMIAPRSVGARVQIFHGISFRNKAVREENLGADHYFMVGPYMRRAFARTGMLPEGDPRALSIGFPKTDRLLNGALRPDALLRDLGLTGHLPVILYAPTGQKKNSLETMGEDVIRSLAATGRYNLLVKPHDHPKNTSIDWFARLAPLQDEHTRVVRDPDVIPLLFLADLLITDASSVSSEYALLDRPMVFLDVPELLAKARAAEGSMLDTETWGRRTGVVVERPQDAADAVAQGLADRGRLSDTRRAMAQDLFFNPGHATDAAIAWFADRFVSRSARRFAPRIGGGRFIRAARRTLRAAVGRVGAALSGREAASRT